jgi:WD40 repeat protein
MLNEDANSQIPIGFKLRHTLQRNKKSINSVAWSPDGHILAVASRDRTIQLWDTAAGKLLQRLKGIPTGEGNPYDLAWSPLMDECLPLAPHLQESSVFGM